jgi:hypothetical protein
LTEYFDGDGNFIDDPRKRRRLGLPCDGKTYYNDPICLSSQPEVNFQVQRPFFFSNPASHACPIAKSLFFTTPNFYPCLSDYMQNQFSEAKAMLPSSTNHVSTTSSLKQGLSRLHAEEGGTNHENSIPVFDKYPESGTRSSHKDPHIAINTSGQLILLVCALFSALTNLCSCVLVAFCRPLLLKYS